MKHRNTNSNSDKVHVKPLKVKKQGLRCRVMFLRIEVPLSKSFIVFKQSFTYLGQNHGSEAKCLTHSAVA